MSARTSDLSLCLRHFPGVVLEIAADGTVSESNGRLPLGQAHVLGRALAELLEPGSREKWRAAFEDSGERPCRIELAFDEGTTYRARSFVLIREPGSARRWLLEQPAEFGDAPLHEEFSALNAELAGAHRDLARERARLERTLRGEAEMRTAAESSRRTLSVLESLGEIALAERDLDVLLARVLARVREGLGVDLAIVTLLDEAGRTLMVRAAEGLAPEVSWPSSTPVGSGVTGRVAASRQVVVAEDLTQASFVNAVAREHLGSLAGAPLIVNDRLLGVLTVGTQTPRPYPPEAVSLLRAAADRLASAIERHRLWEAETVARATAQAAVRQRDEVLAIVAHDLRNPLNRILMATALLKDQLPPDTPARPIEIMQNAVRGMDRLIRDLLDVSRLEAGGLRLERAPVAVPALLAEVCEQFESLAQSRGVALTCSSDDPLTVTADRARVVQALANLLDNALRLTPSGGSVAVRAAPEREYAEFSVADTGPGIAPEQIPHLFDRFWQGMRERRGSAGLGLAIVKGVVESHGGRVFVESTVGTGTTFRFWIPIRP
jgi:signal transduction histidine kinase